MADASGALVWWKILATDSSGVPWANLAVAAWSNGDVAVAGQIVALGYFNDLGGGPVPVGAPTGGVFAATVAASSKVLWTRTFASDSENGNYRVDGVFGPSGTPFLAGGFMGTMDFGTGSKISADGTAPDVFVVALPP